MPGFNDECGENFGAFLNWTLQTPSNGSGDVAMVQLITKVETLTGKLFGNDTPCVDIPTPVADGADRQSFYPDKTAGGA
jgi:hypothetical protein